MIRMKIKYFEVIGSRPIIQYTGTESKSDPAVTSGNEDTSFAKNADDALYDPADLSRFIIFLWTGKTPSCGITMENV